MRVPVDIVQARGWNRLVAEKVEPAIQKRFFVYFYEPEFFPERDGPLPVVVPHDENDVSIQSVEVFNDPLFVSESKVSEMVDRILSRYHPVPVSNDNFVHLRRISEWPTAVFHDVFVSEVRIRNEEVHYLPSLLIESVLRTPAARLERLPVIG